MAEYIGLAVALVLGALALARTYGEDVGGTTARFKAVDQTIDRFTKYHLEHFEHAESDQEHFKDTEMHWTRRERDQLQKTLDDMHSDIKTLLKRGN